MTGRADDLGLVALDRRDRPVDAERGGLDGIARRERAGGRQRCVERADRTLGALRSLGGSAQAPVALRLVPAGAACDADLVAQRAQLLACCREVALRLRDCPLTLGRRSGLYGRDLSLERGLALPG